MTPEGGRAKQGSGEFQGAAARSVGPNLSLAGGEKKAQAGTRGTLP